MENDVLDRTPEVAAASADKMGHQRALERSPSPSSRRLDPVHEFQQEVVPRPTLLSPLERENHVNDLDSPADHSLSQFQQSTSAGEAAISVTAQIKALIEAHRLSREQYMSIYDDYVTEKDQQARLSMTMAHAQAQAAAMLNATSVVAAARAGHGSRPQVTNSDVTENHSSPQEGLSSHTDIGDMPNPVSMETDTASNSEVCGDQNAVGVVPPSLIVDGGEEEAEGDGSQVGKMQSLVRSAMESYETASPVTAELGQKRKHFTLEEELRLLPSPFAQQLLE